MDFAASGPQTIRIQVREDGLSLDQIALSASRFAASAPGATRNDTTIPLTLATPRGGRTAGRCRIATTDAVRTLLRRRHFVEIGAEILPIVASAMEGLACASLGCRPRNPTAFQSAAMVVTAG